MRCWTGIQTRMAVVVLAAIVWLVRARRDKNDRRTLPETL